MSSASRITYPANQKGEDDSIGTAQSRNAQAARSFDQSPHPKVSRKRRQRAARKYKNSRGIAEVIEESDMQSANGGSQGNGDRSAAVQHQNLPKVGTTSIPVRTDEFIADQNNRNPQK